LVEYRREIDGLRAIAVIPVIFFHAGIEMFSGGFVGVDVFFVISGYLITSIILKEKEQGKFSIINFYARRARRILPALFFVMLASILFAWLWLLPGDLEDFSKSLAAVSLFISNFLFLQESGYFATASELIPLLHTWSLAVEEQFYVLFPLFLMLLWWLRKRWILGAIILVGVLSLALAQWGAYQRPLATFFLLPTRAWELMLGASAAFFLLYGNNAKKMLDHNKLTSELFGLVGLLLICVAVVFFNEKVPFPSVYALVPTVGTVLIILFSSDETMVGKLLGAKVLVGIGLVSYSAYLWHHPIFVFARHRSDGEIGQYLYVVLIASSFVLALFSWRYVERPFRDKAKVSQKSIFVYSLAGSLFFIAVGWVGYYMEGFSARLSEEQRSLLAFRKYDKAKIYRDHECFLYPEQSYKDFSRKCGEFDNSRSSLLIWGDSHAAALSFGLREIHGNVMQYTASGCPPIKGFKNPKRIHCEEIIDYVLRKISNVEPDYIMLHANWLYASRFADSIDLHKTINHIRGVSPNSKVVVVGGVPQWEPDLPTVLLRKKITHSDNSALTMPRATKDKILNIDSQIGSASNGDKVTFISAYDLLCDTKGCRVYAGYDKKIMPIAWDYGHLTENGSLLLSNKIIENLPQN
jgi:peptidoglycan/LPS O-acetylase OafA/YrhL